MTREILLRNRAQEDNMTVAKKDKNDFLGIVVANFSKILEHEDQIEKRKKQIAFGKFLALNLISIASIGLLIGFIISLFM